MSRCYVNCESTSTLNAQKPRPQLHKCWVGSVRALGAFHNEKSILLGKQYWASRISSSDDNWLSNMRITCGVQFARTHDRTAKGIRPGLPYDPKRGGAGTPADT